jgi:hypothetical protein
VVAIVVAATASRASAQEVRGMSLGDSEIPLFQSVEPGGLMTSISIQGRVSVPLGTLKISGIDEDYVDAFNGGLGVQGEGSLLFPVGRRWHIGPYLALGWDSYGGTTDRVSGDKLKPDRLELTTFLVGPRALLQMGSHTQLDLHMAFGAAHYSSVDATFTPSGGVPQEGVILRSSTRWAYDLGIRFNVVSNHVFFDVGFDFRTQGTPANGDLPVDPGALFSFGLELGLGVQF